MGIDKTPKLCGLAAFGLGGWLLPLCFDLSPAIEGFSLSLGCFSSGALCLETRRETIVSGIRQTEKKLSLERVAYELVLSHEKELQSLREFYGFGNDDQDDRYDPETQARIEGETLDQRTIAGGSGGNGVGETEGFNFEWRNLEPSLISYPAVALVGSQGSGKTTIAQHLIRLKREAGHEVVVMDPHYRKGEWEGCKVIGAGKNYKAIDSYLAEVAAIVEQRYRQRETQGTENFPPLTIVVEELTCWHGQVENATAFIKSALSDFRKIGIMALFISHSDTNTTWGGAGGTRELRDNSIPFIRPMVKVTPLGAKPLGKAKVSIPGMGAGVIDIPDLRSSPDAGGKVPAMEQSTQTIATLERTIAAPPIEATLPHWEVMDLALSLGGELSVRDAMRRIPALKSADAVKTLFADLMALELGEVKSEGARTIFKPYKPIV